MTLKASGSVEGAGGTGRFPRNGILGRRGHLRGAGAEANLKEGGTWGKHGFHHATEPKAWEVA
jgi:hypothetical protein